MLKSFASCRRVRMDRIVLLGGTFNPLSRAHDRILRLAKEKTGSDKAILLPAADSFLKSWKGFDTDEILPVQTRLKILKAYCKRHRNTFLETIETERKTTCTYDSLVYLKKKFRTNSIFFVMGTEKAEELGRWKNADALLSENRFVMVRRNEDDLKTVIEKENIKKHLQNFRFIDAGKETQDISSTRIRMALHRKDWKTVEALTFSYVVKILKEDNIV